VSSSSSSLASSVSSSSSSVVSSASSSAASSSQPSVALTGVAAVGAPIVNGSVVAKCANGLGFTQAVTTNAQGSFSGNVAADALPCALQISNGSPNITLHSYAFTSGVVNITPLTDLIIANTSTLNPSVWFANNNWQILQSALTLAQTNLKNAMTTGSYTLPQGAFNPFNSVFAIGDIWDQLLDQLQAAIIANNNLGSYANLLTLVKDGNLSSFPPKATPPPAAGFTWTENGGTTLKTATTATYTTQYKTIYAKDIANNTIFEINLTAGTPATYTLNGSANALAYIVNSAMFQANSGSVVITTNASGKMSGTFQASGTAAGGITSVSGTFTTINIVP
jgi:hypothetical protein